MAKYKKGDILRVRNPVRYHYKCYYIESVSEKYYKGYYLINNIAKKFRINLNIEDTDTNDRFYTSIKDILKKL